VNGKKNGYFRMQRGMDSDGIESIPEASIPVLIDLLNDDNRSESLKKQLKWYTQVEN